jgi:3-hydroxy-9,10-secoandrosta-1,3,5(10)-triene-9,17-dione monooxygenase
MLAVKTSEITINKNWNTLGLRGTGSYQVVADNVYVPDYRIVRMSKIEKSVAQPPEDITDNEYVFYNRPFTSAFTIGFSMIALGGAERLLEEFKKRTAQRTRIDGTKEKDSPRSQRVYAELSMKYYEAEGLLQRYIDLIENYSSYGNVPAEEFHALRGRIAQNVVDISVKILLTLGGAATYKGDPVELFTRDLLTLATHRTQLYEDGLAAFGRQQFNL